jgi:hypothetical protein
MFISFISPRGFRAAGVNTTNLRSVHSCIPSSGVVEGDAGGWHPQIILKGDGIPQIIKR